MSKIIGCKVLTIVILIISFVIFSQGCSKEKDNSVKTIVIEGEEFRDLNKNGRLEAYEDWRVPVSERIDDILSKMTLDEKVGLMFPIILNVGENGELVDDPRIEFRTVWARAKRILK